MSGYVVVKLGGEVIASSHMAAIAADIAEMAARGEKVVVVHGGGPQVTDLQKRLGQSPRIIAGRRVTDDDALEAVKMVVAGKMNVDACAALVAAGAMPVGLHGASARVLLAVKRVPRTLHGAGPDPVDLGLVGDVTEVNRELLALLCNSGYVPVIASLGASQDGHVLNINADVVANRVAIALFAKALVLVSDVPGVLADVNDPSSRIARLDTASGRRKILDGVVTKGMIAKLEESFAAIDEGVRAVHIVGRLERGHLAREIAEPGTVGTVLVK